MTLMCNQIMGETRSHTCAVLADDEANALQANSHFLMPEVRDAFLQMQVAAKKAGLDLQICSSFRDFDKQLSIWNRKWRGELALYTLNGEKLDAHTLSDIEKIHAIMLWSALPGASRHHWGTDFDFYDKHSIEEQKHTFELIPEEYSGQGPCSKLCEWVHQHAESFGFFLPYANYVGGVASEPWHLSHKNTASNIEAQFDIEALRTKLAQSDILGKESILPILDELVARYTFNQGNY